MRKLGDSNPRYGNPVRQFSKLVVSATHPNFLSGKQAFFGNAVQMYGKLLDYANLSSIFFQQHYYARQIKKAYICTQLIETLLHNGYIAKRHY